MKEHERLVELLGEAGSEWNSYIVRCFEENKVPSKIYDELYANHLLQNGVMCPPCKVGEKVYTVLDVEHDIGEFEIYTLHCIITDHRIIRYTAECHSHDVDEIWFHDDEIGETVFLTYEEAEKALKALEEKQK